MLMSGFPEVQNDGRWTALCSKIGEIPKRRGEKGETERMRSSINCRYHKCECALVPSTVNVFKTQKQGGRGIMLLT